MAQRLLGSQIAELRAQAPHEGGTADGAANVPQRNWMGRLAWLPIPILLAAMGVLWVANLPGAYGSDSLIMTLNFIFSTLASGLIVFLVSRSFLTRGTPGLLMLGCGVLTWGAAGLVAKAVNQRDVNLDVTIHNTCVWLSALFHFAGALLLLRPRRGLHARELWLGAAYAGVLGVLGLVVLAALYGVTPTFFVQGAGGTTVRQWVLGSAIAMFLLTAGLLRWSSRRPLSAFLCWYTLALCLVALGLFGILIESVYASLLSWMGLAAQFLGGVYMLIAAIASVRESGTWQISLEAALRQSEERFRLMVENVKDYAIFMLDPQGQVTNWNAGAQHVKGYVAEEIVGRNFSCFYAPEDVAAGKPERELALAAELGQYSEEGWRVRKDGSRFWANVTIAAVRDGAGRLRGFVKLAQDRTEQRQMAERVASLAQFPEENPYPVLRISPEGQVVYANGAAKALLGEAEAARSLGALGAEALRQGAAREFDVPCGDGRVYSFHCVPLPEKGYANLYGRDATDARRAGQTLRDSEARYRALTTASSDVVYRMSPDWSEMRQLRGRGFLADTEEPNRNWLQEYIHPDDQPHVQAVINEAIRTKSIFELEHRVLRVDGTLGWTFSRAIPLLDAEGAIVEWFGAASDITERKRAEESLRQSEERYRELVDNANSIIIRMDREGRIAFFNDYAQKFFGYSLEEVLGQNARVLVPPVESGSGRGLAEMVDSILGNPDEFAANINENVRRNGERVWISWRNKAIRDPSGSVIGNLAIGQDITARMRAEEELRAAKLSAEEARGVAEAASKAKDHFLAVLSHELRNPLNPVLATVSMLQRDPRFDADAQEQFDIICRNVEMEARLIDDLLDVTRIERGKIELDRRPVALGMIIRRAVEVCLPDIEARKLEFGVGLLKGADVVEADMARLQQVFWNLLSNAIKFTPLGGCVGIRCRRDGNEGEGFAVVEVSDSGEGIAPEVLPRLFSAFEQGGRPITRQFGGLGLGLTISRALVEMHGGSIQAHSEGKGKGATFTVRLPLMPAAAAMPAAPPSPVMPPVTASTRPLHILLVEDHGDTAKIMRRVLMARGHEVKNAADVATALELAGAQRFDLLLSDLGLPDGSGHDLMRELRKRGLTLPGIALSGFGQEQDLEQSRTAGFAIHLVKPVSPQRLEEAIAHIAGDSQ